jgi:hypothetical protein
MNGDGLFGTEDGHPVRQVFKRLTGVLRKTPETDTPKPVATLEAQPVAIPIRPAVTAPPKRALPIENFPLFEGASPEVIAEIAKACQERTVESGITIIHQGQVGKEIFLLEKGSVGIYVETDERVVLLTVLDAPTVFGEMALVHPERIRTASVKALTESRLLVIPIPIYLALLRRFELLKSNLKKLIAERAANR